MPNSTIDVSIRELETAWRRLKADHADHHFVDHPHLIRWVETDLSGWLAELQAELADGYKPRVGHMCWAPKPGGLLRPGRVLEIKDELVYNVLVGRLLPALHGLIADMQGDPDVAYRLPDKATDLVWVNSSFRVWRQWRERSMEKLDSGASYVLIADITGFYDNIDIRKLMSDVRAIHNEPDELRLLTDCLSTWASPRDRGIPQGYSASHLLAKLFIQSVDRSLLNEQYTHLRYVDDYRVFVSSKREGRQAISRLTELLHRRGLTLQSAKTKVLGKSDAAAAIDGVTVVIRDIATNLMAEILEAEGLDDDYLPVWEIDEILESREGPPPEILERAFQEHFGVAGDDAFDKSVFRYLLTRLGKAKSTVAVDYCLDAVRARPEETDSILRYLSKIGLNGEQLEHLAGYMASADAIYDYQVFQFMRWLYEQEIESPETAALCRNLAYDHNRSAWLRSYCLAYLGERGDESDHANMEDHLSSLEHQVERADVVAALKNMEESRRNGIYGRVEREGGLPARAAKLCRDSG